MQVRILPSAQQTRGPVEESTGPLAFALTVQLDAAAFRLGRPALCLAQGGGEVGLRHTETEPGTACAAAQFSGFFQHQRAPCG